MNLTNESGTLVAEIPTTHPVIQNAKEALELLMNCYYSGTSKLLIYKTTLTPAFFDLKTGLAGDILQKFSNYDGQLAIVGDFSKFTSKSLRDLIRESNKQGRVSFVGSREDAISALTK